MTKTGRVTLIGMTALAAIGCFISTGRCEDRWATGAAPKDSGFRMKDYHVWCGSVLKVDGTYHMFASRWPLSTGFPDGYRTHSEIVRATADNPLGPYTFQEVIIGSREAGRWDSGMAHNPVIYRAGETFALFYIGSDRGSRYRQIGVATASKITGPWKRPDQPLDLGVKSDANNPAALFDENGRTLLIWRDMHLRTRVSVADQVGGPYKVVNDDVFPKIAVEDFFLFKDSQGVHLICEDNVGKLTGHTRFGAHLVSPDGIRDFKPADPLVFYDHDIKFTDGTTLHANRRERPWLLIEGKSGTLFNGVWDGTQACNRAVPVTLPQAAR